MPASKIPPFRNTRKHFTLPGFDICFMGNRNTPLPTVFHPAINGLCVNFRIIHDRYDIGDGMKAPSVTRYASLP